MITRKAGEIWLKVIKDADMFLNDNYLVLMVLYNNQQKINNHIFTAITQQEIGESLDFSLMKVNAIMKKLKESGYITAYRNARGRYQLTDKADTLIKGIKKLKGEK